MNRFLGSFFVFLLCVSLSCGQGFDVNNTESSGTGLSSAQAGVTVFFNVQLMTASNQPSAVCPTNPGIDMTMTMGSNSVVVSQQCTLGLITASYRAKISGDWTLRISYEGQDIPGSPFTVVVTPGVIYPPSSSAEGQLSGGTVGVDYSFKITPRDIFGNLITSCPAADWQVLLTGAASVTGTVSKTCDASGNYTAQYAAQVSGGYDMTVGISNSNLPDSPYHLKFVPGETDVAHSVATGAYASASTAGQFSPFQIQCKDQYDNPVSSCDIAIDDWVANLVDGSISEPINVTGCTNGVYNANYQVTLAATFKLEITANSVQIANYGQDVVISADSNINAANTNATGSGLTTAVAGNPAPIYIQPYDKYDNKITSCLSSSEWSDFVISLESEDGEEGCNGNVKSCSNGLYTAQYDCDIATTYDLDIKYNTNPISHSPFHPTVVPGPIDSQHSRASGSGLSTAQAGVAATFKVQAYDQYDNIITTCVSNPTSAFQVSLVGAQDPDLKATGSVYNCSNGIYSMKYTVTTVTTYLLTIDHDSNPVDASPYVVVVSPGPPNKANCKVGGSGLSGAVAGQSAGVWAQCSDQYNNPIRTCYPSQDWSLVLYFNDWSITVDGSAASCTDSTSFDPANVSFTYVATKAGTYNLYLNFSQDSTSTVIGQSHPIITPGAADPSMTGADGPGVTSQDLIAGSNTYFDIYPADQYGNKISTCPTTSLKYAVTFSPSAGVLSLNIGSCSGGNTRVTYTPTKAGSLSVSVTYGGTAIHDSPFGVFVVAGAIDPSSIVASGSGLTSGIAGLYSNFSMSGYDQYKNPINQCFQSNYGSFSITLKGVNSPVTRQPYDVAGSVYSCSNGVYLASYNATVAGNYTMQVTYLNAPIQSNPFHPIISAGAPVDSKAVASGNGFNNPAMIAGSTVSVIITLHDAFQNPTTYCPPSDYWNVTVYSMDQVFTFTNSHCVSGVSTQTYSLYKAGSYLVSVSGKQGPVSNPSGSVTVVAAAWSVSSSVADQFTNYVAGSTVPVTIYGLDQYGNNITSCPSTSAVPLADWNVNAYGATAWNGSITSCTGAANFKGTIVVGEVGVVTVRINYNGTEISNSPWSATFLTGVVAAPYTEAVGLGVDATTDQNIAGNYTSFQILFYNQYGVRISGQPCNTQNWTVTLSPSPYNPYPGQHMNFFCTAPASYVQVQYNATVADIFAVGIAFHGVAIQNKYNVKITPADIYINNTAVILNTNAVNGSSPSNGTFYLQVKDKYGNDVTNVSTSFEVELSPLCANATAAPSGNVSNGLIEYDYEAQEGGIYCIEVFYQLQRVNIPEARLMVVGGELCAEQNYCSEKGYCFKTIDPADTDEAYSCSCFTGYVGDDCSEKRSSVYPLKKGAIIGMTIGIAIFMFIVGLILGYFLFKGKKNDDQVPLMS